MKCHLEKHREPNGVCMCGRGGRVGQPDHHRQTGKRVALAIEQHASAASLPTVDLSSAPVGSDSPDTAAIYEKETID